MRVFLVRVFLFSLESRHIYFHPTQVPQTWKRNAGEPVATKDFKLFKLSIFIVKCVGEPNICNQTKGFIQHLSYLQKSSGIKMRINSQRAPTRA